MEIRTHQHIHRHTHTHYHIKAGFQMADSVALFQRTWLDRDYVQINWDSPFLSFSTGCFLCLSSCTQKLVRYKLCEHWTSIIFMHCIGVVWSCRKCKECPNHWYHRTTYWIDQKTSILLCYTHIDISMYHLVGGSKKYNISRNSDDHLIPFKFHPILHYYSWHTQYYSHGGFLK